MDSNLKLMITMINAQKSYVLNRIDGKKNQDTYRTTGYLLTKHLDRFNTYDEAINDYYKRSIDLECKIIPGDWFGYKLKYRNLAIDHIDDIIKSINIRFVKGVRSDDIR